MGKTWKDKPRKYGRSHIPPPGHVHEDKRKKPRSQERQDVKREFDPFNTLNENY